MVNEPYIEPDDDVADTLSPSASSQNYSLEKLWRKKTMSKMKELNRLIHDMEENRKAITFAWWMSSRNSSLRG